jgi:hypothetical protein
VANDQPTDRQTVAERLRWAPTPTGPPWRALIREPSRAIAVLGAVLIVVASLLPWGWAFTRDGRVVVNGYDAAGDGAIMSVLSVILVWALLNATMAEADTRVIQLVPIAIGVTCAILWLVALRESDGPMPAFWVTGVGAALTAIGGAWTTRRMIARSIAART